MNSFPHSRLSDDQAVLILKQLYFPVIRFSLVPQMMAETRSIALASDRTVAVILAMVVRFTRSEFCDCQGHWLLSSVTSSYVPPGSMPRRFLLAFSSVARFCSEVHASGCDGEPTFFVCTLNELELSKTFKSTLRIATIWRRGAIFFEQFGGTCKMLNVRATSID
jgi:hypothetical protein